MIYTFSAVFVRFVAPTSGEEALVSKPVAARGFMSGRGPLADVAKDKLVCPAARQTVGGTK